MVTLSVLILLGSTSGRSFTSCFLQLPVAHDSPTMPPMFFDILSRGQVVIIVPSEYRQSVIMFSTVQSQFFLAPPAPGIRTLRKASDARSKHNHGDTGYIGLDDTFDWTSGMVDQIGMTKCSFGKTSLTSATTRLKGAVLHNDDRS